MEITQQPDMMVHYSRDNCRVELYRILDFKSGGLEIKEVCNIR
jgi:hypothetical protein